MGLESKRGLSRYLHARDYRKAAQETLKFVKVFTSRTFLEIRFLISSQTVADRARDATVTHMSAFPGPDTVSVQHPEGPHLDAIPLQATPQNPIPIDPEASGEAHFYYSPDPTDLYVHSDPRATNIRRQLGAEMKPKLATLVETLYNFKTGHDHTNTSYNARRAQGLLRHMNFIYPVRLRYESLMGDKFIDLLGTSDGP